MCALRLNYKPITNILTLYLWDLLFKKYFLFLTFYTTKIIINVANYYNVFSAGAKGCRKCNGTGPRTFGSSLKPRVFVNNYYIKLFKT